MGIIHRDIKPENLLIDHWNNIRIGDFGAAYVDPRAIPMKQIGACTNDVVGTECYMAPELITNLQRQCYYGYAVDYWSLGCVAYELEENYSDRHQVRSSGFFVRKSWWCLSSVSYSIAQMTDRYIWDGTSRQTGAVDICGVLGSETQLKSLFMVWVLLYCPILWCCWCDQYSSLKLIQQRDSALQNSGLIGTFIALMGTFVFVYVFHCIDAYQINIVEATTFCSPNRKVRLLLFCLVFVYGLISGRYLAAYSPAVQIESEHNSHHSYLPIMLTPQVEDPGSCSEFEGFNWINPNGMWGRHRALWKSSSSKPTVNCIYFLFKLRLLSIILFVS